MKSEHSGMLLIQTHGVPKKWQNTIYFSWIIVTLYCIIITLLLHYYIIITLLLHYYIIVIIVVALAFRAVTEEVLISISWLIVTDICLTSMCGLASELTACITTWTVSSSSTKIVTYLTTLAIFREPNLALGYALSDVWWPASNYINEPQQGSTISNGQTLTRTQTC